MNDNNKMTDTNNEDEIYSEQLTEQFKNVLDTLTTFKHSMTALQTQIKFLEKGVTKELKQVHSKIKKKKEIQRKPSGFATPSMISNELCNFMGKEPNSKIARTEVTKFVIQYIKDKQLQYKENKKIIVPDDNLSKLLGVENDNETVITYFNIQRYMNKHFIKST
jgi:chromatin remodeling complex protein RSC6